MHTLITLADIRAAADRIRGFARITPALDSGADAGGGRPLWLKCENLQRTGAFKIRGAANVLRQLSDEARARGVITFSSGNHGLALAAAAHALGCPAVVVMPTHAPAVKVDGVRRLGADVVFEGTTTLERQARADAEARRRGLTMVPPFDHAGIIAGQGTIGLELLEQCPDLGAVLVPASGGGLVAGVATAIKQLAPHVRVVAVEPAVTPRFTKSLEAGCPVTVPAAVSIADGLIAVRPGTLTFAHVATYVDEVVTVGDTAMADTVRWLFVATRLVAEPSGASATAAVLTAAPTTWTRDGRSYRDSTGRVAAVISGGNVDAATFAAFISPASVPGGPHA